LRGRPTEIDYLNGHVVRRGKALGINTPANQVLSAMVKLVECSPWPVNNPAISPQVV